MLAQHWLNSHIYFWKAKPCLERKAEFILLSHMSHTERSNHPNFFFVRSPRTLFVFVFGIIEIKIFACRPPRQAQIFRMGHSFTHVMIPSVTSHKFQSFRQCRFYNRVYSACALLYPHINNVFILFSKRFNFIVVSFDCRRQIHCYFRGEAKAVNFGSKNKSYDQ